MTASLMLLYALAVYASFLLTFLYAVGFVANWDALPTTIDAVPSVPSIQAVAIDLLLLGLFAFQHSVMARPAFKRWWTRWVPAPVERSTYVLFATAALALLLWHWQPVDGPMLWQLTSSPGRMAAWTVFGVGWAILLASTFLLDHFELFGLRQVATHWRDGQLPAPTFRTPGLYRVVRHPIYLGFLLGFWATPHMSASHGLFALGFTAYILVGVWFEERDLVAQFGDRYRGYRQQVGMLLPRPARSPRRDPIDR